MTLPLNKPAMIEPSVLSQTITETRSSRLFVRNGDATALTLFLLGMAAVAGMLLTIGAMQ